MKTAILMVTYRKDLDFAVCAMRSTTKFATGFSDKLLIVPNEDVALFSGPALEHGYRIEGFNETPQKGMLHHMVMVLQADLLCPDADVILHQDGDCLFTAPVTPDDYLHEGKPVVLRQRYEEFKAYASRYSWKACVQAATGIDPEWETMVRHPNVFRRDTYRRTREAIERHTGMDWQAYILAQRNLFPQTFAEFPTLGAVAIAQTPEDYCWASLVAGQFEDHEPGPSKMKDFWSHGGLEMDNDRHPGRTARQVIEAILGDKFHLKNRLEFGRHLSARGLTGHGVEVGVLFGEYSEHLLANWPGFLHMVDPWLQQPTSVYLDGCNACRMEEAYFKACQVILKYEGRAKIHRSFSVHAAKEFGYGTLDFVYLDGNHSLESVRADLVAWWPKIKAGGILGGHDFFDRHDAWHDCGVKEGVLEWVAANGLKLLITPECTSWWIEKPHE
jgi:hypothetical protein